MLLPVQAQANACDTKYSYVYPISLNQARINILNILINKKYWRFYNSLNILYKI